MSGVGLSPVERQPRRPGLPTGSMEHGPLAAEDVPFGTLDVGHGILDGQAPGRADRLEADLQASFVGWGAR